MDQNILNNLLNTQGHINEEELNAYLKDDTLPALRHKVENAMLDTPLYADAVEGYQEMGMDSLPTLEDFSEFKKKLPAPMGAKIVQLTPAQRFMRVAAVAGVLILAVVGYNSFQPSTPGELFTDYYTHYGNDISLARRGDTEGMNKDFKYALGQYAIGEFAVANVGFKRALEAEPSNDAVHFFSGMAHIETGNFTEATEHLTIVKNNNGTYARKAFWYSILVTINTGDVDKAKNLLGDFLKKPGYKNGEAEKLLNEL